MNKHGHQIPDMTGPRHAPPGPSRVLPRVRALDPLTMARAQRDAALEQAADLTAHLVEARRIIEGLRVENATLRAASSPDAILQKVVVRDTRLAMAMIVAEVALAAGLPVDVLRGRDRRAYAQRPRARAMRLMQDAGWSLPQIGRFMGGRGHTTVLDAIRRDRAAEVAA